MKKEKIEIKLTKTYTENLYDIIYKSQKYTYSYVYKDGFFIKDNLIKLGNEKITEEEYNTIMKYIIQIDDWTDYE